MRKTFNSWLKSFKKPKEEPVKQKQRDPSSCICDLIRESSKKGNVASGFCPYHRISWH